MLHAWDLQNVLMLITSEGNSLLDPTATEMYHFNLRNEPRPESSGDFQCDCMLTCIYSLI